MTSITIPNFKNLISEYIFAYAYPIAFLGAVFLGTSEIFGFEPITMIHEKIVIFLNIIIGVAGLLSIFNWFNEPIPVVGDIIIDRRYVKQNF